MGRRAATPQAPGSSGRRGGHVSFCGPGLGVVRAANARPGAGGVRAAVRPGRAALSATASAPAAPPPAVGARRFLLNVVLKAALLFAVIDLLVTVVDPLPALG